ncbi:MAG TPA: glycoside hydrolase family 15 protein, partial [Gemmatimonadales bacterium]|nr:glycoside hydrolase family 15 protein [Gemmatimonadales bacterium]
TNVLETTFRTRTGTVRVVDCMPVTLEAEKRKRLWPDRDLLRIIEGVEGEVELEITCAPRPDYGRVTPILRDRGALGFYYDHEARALILRSDIPLRLSEEHSLVTGRARIRPGQRAAVHLVQSEQEIAILPALGAEAERQLERSLAWWGEWAARCRYQGPWREQVIRSALTLKLMCFAPSGAVVAAPTTSLPEALGQSRNWDYRYCWLRDASLTLQALFDLGYPQEAAAFVSWLLHTTGITRPELQILYDIYGESHLRERKLGYLAGYAGSRPVRVGNAAHDQLQLDVYGEVIDAVYEFVSRGGRLDRPAARMLRGWGDTVLRRWTEPDEGIWEIRCGRRQHTFSKAMCWIAVDRLIRLAEEGHLRLDLTGYRSARDAIQQAIESQGFDAGLGSYVSEFGGRELDASLLLLDRLGYVEPASERMAGTYRQIEERLGHNGLLYRYRADDGINCGEGAFGVCSFWAVSYLARAGRLPEAERLFEHLLGFANDVGLYAEEIDPDNGGALGNFPQAFTHVGLIDAALTMEQCRGGRPRGAEPQEAKTLI